MKFLVAVGALLALAHGAQAQTAAITLTDDGRDGDAPIEIVSDRLEFDNETGLAVFIEDVVVTQDTMTILGDRVEVYYDAEDSATSEAVAAATDTEDEGSEIQRVVVIGNVALITPDERAESERAIYTTSDDMMDMRGNVFVTQGRNLIYGDALKLNVESGQGTMTGRIRAVLNQSADE